VSESDKDKVEVATFSQDLRPLSLSKIKALQLSQSRTIEPQAPRTNCKLPLGLRRSIAKTVAALVGSTQSQRLGLRRSLAGTVATLMDDARSWCSRLGGVADQGA
jgi:hypothetical protein